MKADSNPSASTLRARERAREWYAANRERALANGRRHSIENAEKKRAVAKAWYLANHEYATVRKAAYREAHTEEARAYHADWRARNPLEAGAGKRRYRARLVLAPCPTTTRPTAERGCSHVDGPQELDHIVPVRLGGCSHEHNLQILCKKCNRKKSGSRPALRAGCPAYWTPAIWTQANEQDRSAA